EGLMTRRGCITCTAASTRAGSATWSRTRAWLRTPSGSNRTQGCPRKRAGRRYATRSSSDTPRRPDCPGTTPVLCCTGRCLSNLTTEDAMRQTHTRWIVAGLAAGAAAGLGAALIARGRAERQALTDQGEAVTRRATAALPVPAE